MMQELKNYINSFFLLKDPYDKINWARQGFIFSFGNALSSYLVTGAVLYLNIDPKAIVHNRDIILLVIFLLTSFSLIGYPGWLLYEGYVGPWLKIKNWNEYSCLGGLVVGFICHLIFFILPVTTFVAIAIVFDL